MNASTGVALAEVVAYLDDLLRVAEFRDWKNALNGLQVANSGRVHRVAAAVDASEQTITGAAAKGCDLLLVHHGLFWGGNRPITGSRYRRLHGLFAADVAVYSAHLPLDVHPELGNNALLAREICKVAPSPCTDEIQEITYGEATGTEILGPRWKRLRQPIPLLNWIAIVDTPGTNAIIREHQAITEEFVPRSDLVLFITSADRPFTESERSFLHLFA